MELTWTPEKRKVSDLKELPNNPRIIKGEAFEKLKQRIAARGFHDVVKVDTDGYVLSGNQRRKALTDLGIKEVYTLVPSRPLTKEERDKVILESNRNDGEWDFDILGNEFDLQTLLDVGFAEKDLDINLTGQNDDDVPEAPDEPVSKLGDLYILGNHRVLCGDSTKMEDVERLMDARKADLVVTDPPYNTGMDGAGKDAKARLSHMFNDKIENWPQFLNDVFTNYFTASKGDCAFYVFIDWRKVQDIRATLEKLMDVKNVIVWDKQVHGLGSDYKFTYELCVVGKKGKPEIQNRFGTDYQDILRVQRQMGRNESHATAKPIELLTKPILHASKRDDIVLDLFLGSGSTLIAAEKTGRICYGMELDPKYVDVIVKRWEDFTGKKAELIRE